MTLDCNSEGITKLKLLKFNLNYFIKNIIYNKYFCWGVLKKNFKVKLKNLFLFITLKVISFFLT